MSDGLKYTAASLGDIAGMFDAKADTAHAASLSRAQSASSKYAAKREAHVWRAAAETLRNTTITSTLPVVAWRADVASPVLPGGKPVWRGGELFSFEPKGSNVRNVEALVKLADVRGQEWIEPRFNRSGV